VCVRERVCVSCEFTLFMLVCVNKYVCASVCVYACAPIMHVLPLLQPLSLKHKLKQANQSLREKNQKMEQLQAHMRNVEVQECVCAAVCVCVCVACAC
jgi:ABC-type protease/lipase transport system fused ATPase/permease subunit